MKIKLAIIISELFQVSLVTYLILLLVETIKEGFVSNFFNLNILLAIVLVSGVGMVLTNAEKYLPKKDMVGDRRVTELNWIYIFVMSLGGGFLIYFKTSQLGNIAIAISTVAALIIFLLSYLIFTESD